MTVSAIELDQVSLGWRDRVAVRDITGTFLRGSLTALVGPNGAGKSTLIKGLMGQLSPLRGTIRFAPDVVDQMACLPQVGDLDKSFPVTVYDLVALGAWKRTGWWRRFGQAEHARVQKALETVGLADFGRRIIGTLSGGQLQRALFARLMMHDARVLILDEPFANLDPSSQYQLRGIIKNFPAGNQKTILISSHDLDHVTDVCSRIVILEKGKVIRDEAKTESTLAELEEFFTGVKVEKSFLEE